MLMYLFYIQTSKIEVYYKVYLCLLVKTDVIRQPKAIALPFSHMSVCIHLGKFFWFILFWREPEPRNLGD